MAVQHMLIRASFSVAGLCHVLVQTLPSPTRHCQGPKSLRSPAEGMLHALARLSTEQDQGGSLYMPGPSQRPRNGVLCVTFPPPHSALLC